MAIHLRRLWLSDYRSYHEVDVSFPDGVTAVIGRNGQGKTNLIEAIAWLAGTSLRGASTDTLVRIGADRAVVRAEATRGNRDLLIEAELVANGRNRLQLNRQAVRRRRDLLDALAVTVFSPDDLVLVKGGPGERRRWLDAALVGLDTRNESLQSEVDKILKQRNALLKGAKGRLDESARLTLDVWDERLTRAGESLADIRRKTLAHLEPFVHQAYDDIAGAPLPVAATYGADWADVGLATALADARTVDVRRGLTTVGPHRDDVSFALDSMPSRSHASQGEQRTLALALRLAVHRAIGEATGESPILLLDDVLSELDEGRTNRLLDHLPPGQTLLTTAAHLPERARPDHVLRIDGGRVVADG